MIKSVSRTIVAGLVFILTAATALANPEDFVQNLSNNVVATLQDPDSDRAAKLDRLKGLLDEAADLELLAKLILGRHWRTASADEQNQYVEVFRKLVNKTMADRLSDYGGETIEVTGSQNLNERDTMVNTLVHRTDGGPPFEVNWRIRQANDRAAVIDVIAEGISLVVTQRAEIGEIVNRKGMNGLIADLRARLES